MEVTALLYEFKDVFCTKHEELPISNLPPYHIKLRDTTPVRQKPYPMSTQAENMLEQYVDRQLAAGIVEPSDSPFNSPAILVRKRSYDPKNPSIDNMHLCIDYRQLDHQIQDLHAPLVTVESVINRVAQTNPVF